MLGKEVRERKRPVSESTGGRLFFCPCVCVRLRARRVARRLWASRITGLIRDLDLEHLFDRPAHGLSAGEAQRVALVRALVIRPKALLLDEPTANVDSAKISRIETVLLDARERCGTTIVFSTHNHAQAERLSDQVFRLSGGRPERVHGGPWS